MENSGFSIGGSAKVNIGNSAVGANSAINVITHTNDNKGKDIEELSKLFDSLLAELNATTEHIPEKEDIVASVASLKEEIKKEKPNKITLGSIGKAVLDNLKYVKDVAPIAEIIWQQLGSFLS